MIARTGWSGAFRVSGVFSLVLAAAAWLIFLRYEKTGLVVPRGSGAKGEKGSFSELFRTDRFILFLFLAMLTEIAISSVGFWIPTYLTERLGCSPETSGEIFSVMSLVQSLGAFAVLLVVKLFKDDCVKTICLMFALSALFFSAMAFVSGFGVSVVLLGAARFSSGMASSALWAVYIPSLADTGKVSGANGILDFAGYLGASGANLLLTALIEPLGWARMPLAFAAFALVGTIACLMGMSHNCPQNTDK